MRISLRFQLIILLGGLFAFAFLPLQAAVTAYVDFAVRDLRGAAAVALTEAAASHVEEASRWGRSNVREMLIAQSAKRGGVEAIAIYNARGQRTASAGAKAPTKLLPSTAIATEPGQKPAVSFLSGARLSLVQVVLPLSSGTIIALVRPEGTTRGSGPVVRLIGAYMGMIALALLVFAFFFLTRLIVRPLDRISRSAEQVAGGSRTFEIPQRAPRELRELGHSLRHMTETLLAKEQKLRDHVLEIERQAEVLRSAQATLVRTERLASVGRLSAGLAHEIGNPLAALIGIQDLLAQDTLNAEERRDFVERMRRETARIHGILGDLLAFARAGGQAARGETEPEEPGIVSDAVSDTLALLTPQKDLRGLHMETELEDGLPAVVLSREKLVQVLLNLLLNAADACPDGASARVTATREDDQHVVLHVEDNGPGISADVRDRLFEPFVTTKEVGQGTGLGLAVCRGLLESVGGTLELDTSYTDGARFSVILPIADPTKVKNL